MKRQIFKLILLSVLAVAGCAAASAQLRYAAVAGPDMSTLKFKQDLVNVSGVTNYQLGVQGEVIFPGLGFGLDLGLIYEHLGAKVNLGERKVWASQGYGNEQVHLHYVQIPLHLRFKWTRMNGLEDIVAPFVYGGPDFNILVGHGHCNAFEYAGGNLGLSCGGGFEFFHRWQLSGGYSWGMTYALKTKLLDNYSAKNRSWTIRLAYFF